jgi:hypothetical protein
MNPRIVHLAVAVAALLISISRPNGAFGQAPEPTTREALVERIKEMARRHVENNEPMKSDLVLDLYRQNSVGLSPPEVVDTYETEYTVAKKARGIAWDFVLRMWSLIAIVLVMLYFVRRIQQKLRLRRLIAEAERAPPRPAERLSPPSQEDGRVPPAFTVSPTPREAEPAASRPEPETPAESNKASSTLSRQLAGMRVLRGYALVCYRAGVLNDFKDLVVQFDPARPLSLSSLFVMPRLRDGNSEIDPFVAIVRYPRLLVRAPSGGGKSVLLRRMALAALQEGIPNLRGRPIPVLVELRRLTPARLANKADANGKRSVLEQELVDELDRRGFPNADLFLGRSLDQGRILLLFDGLDEVKGGVRGEVARLIKDLLKKYPNARAVITCRRNVYKNEFAQAVDASLELEDLNDLQVIEFLANWKRSLPGEGSFSVEQFLKCVHGRERVVPLVRNPLLLSVLAFLYCERPQDMPDSRTALFARSIDHQLGRSNPGQGSPDKEAKRAVLARLALAMHETAEAREGDGLSLEQPIAVTEARKAVADLPREFALATDAERLLRELTERDPLLVGFNGGYGFRHREFQDYFAAAALANDGAGLVQRFRRNPAVWLKTVKFWCGMDHDSTDVLSAIFAEDPLTALLCLGEATQASPELAGRILAAFRERLGSGPDDPLLCRAFAAAVHQEQCGSEVFGTLVQALSASERPVRRATAARALALSHTGRAAAELSRVFADGPEFRKALEEMGDLAVPELAELAANGNVQALDALRVIGTPLAAVSLTKFLWSADADLATTAAWRLAALLQRPSVEAALERYEFSGISPTPGAFDWIWQPFAKSDRSPLLLIAGQIATLLERAPVETAPAPPVEMDPRLVIPLCGIIKKQDAWRLTEELPAKMRSTVTHTIRKSTGKRLSALDPGKLGAVDTETAESRARFVSLVLHLTQPTKSWQYLFESLKPDVQFNFLFGLFQGPSPRRVDWLELKRAPTWRNMRSRNPLRAFAVETPTAAPDATPAKVPAGAT